MNTPYLDALREKDPLTILDAAVLLYCEQEGSDEEIAEAESAAKELIELRDTLTKLLEEKRGL